MTSHSSLHFILLSVLSLSAHALAAELKANPAQQCEQWGIFEVALKGPSDGNPFTDVRFSATFTHDTLTHEVAGFYDGDGMYRVRFMPEVPGEWRYETSSNRWPLD